MKKADVAINLRLPPELHRRLVKSAAARMPRNSLNREILERLVASIVGEPLVEPLVRRSQ